MSELECSVVSETAEEPGFRLSVSSIPPVSSIIFLITERSVGVGRRAPISPHPHTTITLGSILFRIPIATVSMDVSYQSLLFYLSERNDAR